MMGMLAITSTALRAADGTTPHENAADASARQAFIWKRFQMPPKQASTNVGP
jgi:hypothetical protein